MSPVPVRWLGDSSVGSLLSFLLSVGSRVQLQGVRLCDKHLSPLSYLTTHKPLFLRVEKKISEVDHESIENLQISTQWLVNTALRDPGSLLLLHTRPSKCANLILQMNAKEASGIRQSTVSEKKK